MARITLTYGGMDLNDGTTWHLMPGWDLGERQKSWDEVTSYTGLVTQLNVTEAHLVPMALPLMVEGADAAAVRSEIDALNALVDAGEQDLVFDDGSGAVTYECAYSQRPRVDYSYLKTCIRAFVDFQPVRYPEEESS